MSGIFVSLLTNYGSLALFGMLIATSVGFPFPDSLLLLIVGSFTAQGELDTGQVIAAGIAGAVTGDQIGYALGRWGGRPMAERLAGAIGRRDDIGKAASFARRWGGAGIFFSRWLIGVLGPWINLTSGMTSYPWPRFLIWDVLGEAIWVVLYVGLGNLFSDRVLQLSRLLGNVSWAIAGIVVTIFLGWRLFIKPKSRTDAGPASTVGDGRA